MAKLTRYFLVGIIIFLKCSQGFPAETNQTIFPEEFKDRRGNAPLSPFNTQVPTYQQLFRASVLSPLWSSPVLIHEIAFRTGGGDFSDSVSHIEIRLSTSPKTPESMVGDWSQNKGVDDTVVFSHENVGFSRQSELPVNSFGVVFKLDKPFYYDPRNGSLLLKMDNTGIASGNLDGNAGPTFQSAPFSASLPESRPGVPQRVLPYGLITEFTWTTVPEPSTQILFASGVLALGVLKVSKGRRRENS